MQMTLTFLCRMLWKWWYNIIDSDNLRHGNQNLSRNSKSYFQMASKIHGKFVFANAFFIDGSRRNIFSLEN